jgi:hypothetical protein
MQQLIAENGTFRITIVENMVCTRYCPFHEVQKTLQAISSWQRMVSRHNVHACGHQGSTAVNRPKQFPTLISKYVTPMSSFLITAAHMQVEPWRCWSRDQTRGAHHRRWAVHATTSSASSLATAQSSRALSYMSRWRRSVLTLCQALSLVEVVHTLGGHSQTEVRDCY